MNEFKVGDKVKVKYFEYRPFHWNMEGEMDKYMGREFKISEINKKRKKIYLSIDKSIYNWAWKESDFEEVNFLKDEDLML